MDIKEIEIMKRNIEIMNALHERLEQVNYFNLYGNEARQKILVTQFLECKKQFYFSGVKP